MKDFKLLHLPLSEDRTENIINSLGKILPEDESGDYIIQLIDVLLDYFSNFPYSESPELNRAESRLVECKYWLEQFYSDESSNEEGQEEGKDKE